MCAQTIDANLVRFVYHANTSAPSAPYWNSTFTNSSKAALCSFTADVNPVGAYATGGAVRPGSELHRPHGAGADNAAAAGQHHWRV